MAEFKPNLYPIMYWAALYGVTAGLVLFAVNVLSNYITYVWFPVFLAGVIWGGYRNYQRQKRAFVESRGVAAEPQAPMAEFKQAAADVVAATRDMMQEAPADTPPSADSSDQSPGK